MAKGVSSSAEMSRKIVKRSTRTTAVDHGKKRHTKRVDPVLGKPVNDGDELLIKF